MKDEQKLNLQHEFHRFQQRKEAFYAVQFRKALNMQTNQAIAQIKAGRPVEITSLPIYNVIQPLYNDVALAYGAKMLTAIKREQKGRRPMGFSVRIQQLMLQYFGLDFLAMSEDITQTTRDYIQKILLDSYPLGLGISDLVDRIEGTEINRQRARVIARTETVAAANNGGLIVAKDTGMELNKIWLSAKDNRTRRDHILAHKSKVHIDEFFIVGGYKMKVPGYRGGKDGQPKVPGKLVINCRCSSVYEPIKGAVSMPKPLPKPKPLPIPAPIAEPVLLAFKPAATIKEAEDFAKTELRANVGSMKGVNIDVANKLNKTLFEIEQKYPNTKPANVAFEGVTGRAYMQYDWEENLILIRKNYKDVENRLSSDNIEWNKKYGDRYTVSETFEDLIKHEFGHHIDNSSGRDAYNNIEKLDLGIRNKAYGISGYASTDRFYTTNYKGSEMIAELTASYLKNEIRFNTLPTELQDIIKKSFK